MKEYNLDRNNAYDIASRIIKCEERLEIDTERTDEMDFERKCKFVVECNKYWHLTADMRMHDKVYSEIRAELESQADNNNPEALFTLGMDNYSGEENLSDKDKEHLINSAINGNNVALLEVYEDLYGECPEKGLPRLYSVYNAKSLQTSIFSFPVRSLTMYQVYKSVYLISKYSDDGDKEDTKKCAESVKFSGLAKGCYPILRQLINESNPKSEEYAFYKTIEFIVFDYFYDKGYKDLGFELSKMYRNGIGCNKNVMYAAEIMQETLRFMQNKQY